MLKIVLVAFSESPQYPLVKAKLYLHSVFRTLLNIRGNGEKTRQGQEEDTDVIGRVFTLSSVIWAQDNTLVKFTVYVIRRSVMQTH